MAKKKIKLNEEQKRWHQNLLEYIQKGGVRLDTEQNLKECILDGPFAILSVRGDFDWDCRYFDCIVCTDTFEEAKVVVKWSCSTASHVIDLREPKTMYEERRRWQP